MAENIHKLSDSSINRNVYLTKANLLIQPDAIDNLVADMKKNDKPMSRALK